MTATAQKKARLALGTVQLGLPYGAANRIGLPDESAAVAIVKAAIDAGITTLDTARAYGDAERRIGLACPPGTSPVEIVTKLDPLAHVPSEAATEVAVAAARASLAASREALRRHRLDILLLHRAHHRTAWSGAVWDMLCVERDTGGIGRLGVSVQTPTEALAALDDRDVRHLQLPFNLLDRRWAAAGVVDALRTRTDVVVHVRSIFLQGLFAGDPAARWPAIRGLDPKEVLDHLSRLADAFNRQSLADLALAFVRAQDWIDGIVIGMETMDHLFSNLELFKRPPLRENEVATVHNVVPELPVALLDPAQWPLKSTKHQAGSARVPKQEQ